MVVAVETCDLGNCTREAEVFLLSYFRVEEQLEEPVNLCRVHLQRLWKKASREPDAVLELQVLEPFLNDDEPVETLNVPDPAKWWEHQ